MKAIVCEHHRYDSVLRVGSHHVARELAARGWEVVWLPHARSWLHRLVGRLPPPVVRHPDGVTEITVVAPAPYIDLPLLGSRRWGSLWLRSTKGPRARLAATGADRCDLLWVSDFTMLPLLDTIDAATTVWRFFDHVDRFARMPPSVLELALAHRDRADLIVASSRDVQARLRTLGLDCRYLPNGAAVPPGRPDDPPGTGPPRFVYVGALGPWFDLPAVEAWADALPEALFEIAGPNPAHLRSDRPNVRFLGPVPYGDVPRLLAGARAGLIPFEVNELTRGVHPLKLYDYLAAGRPVLSSALPEVDPDPENGVFVYRTYEEGAAALHRILDAPPPAALLRRRAEANDWAHRLRSVEEMLGRSL